MTDYISDNFNLSESERIISHLNWTEFVTESGPPPVTLNYTNYRANSAFYIANQYISLNGTDSPIEY